MKPKIRFLVFTIIIFFSFSILSITPINARPGGGHSYSNTTDKSNNNSSNSSNNNYNYNNHNDNNDDNDNSSYDYGYSSDNSESSGPWYVKILSFIFMFAVLALNSLAFTAFQKYRAKRKIISSASETVISKNNKKLEKELLKLKKSDPNFSKTLFLDFVSSFYNKHYTWLGKDEYKNLSPFLSSEYLEKSKTYENSVSEIVIGSIAMSEIAIETEVQKILVKINANYTVTKKVKKKETKLRRKIVEKWLFVREAGVLSHDPNKMLSLACPNCGATNGFSDSGVCESCGTIIKNGEMQWFLKNTKIVSESSYKTEGLAYYAEEQGTADKTIIQSSLEKNAEIFAQNHKINWNSWEKQFETKVVKEYFKNIYEAYSQNNLTNVRNLLSDRIYTSFMFWLNEYKNEGLVNKLKKLSILKVRFVKLELDKYYESATVRIHASVLDYVENAEGKKIGGSKRKKRIFSEYWTFIRRTGVEIDDYNYSTCPNCGAPTDKMGQTGTCGYCNSKISNGNFSWVLSIITQDEVYKG